jgi:hypothetical protein
MHDRRLPAVLLAELLVVLATAILSFVAVLVYARSGPTCRCRRTTRLSSVDVVGPKPAPVVGGCRERPLALYLQDPLTQARNRRPRGRVPRGRLRAQDVAGAEGFEPSTP